MATRRNVSRPVLLDASFLIALERATARRETGRLTSLRGRRLVISVVTIEEMLEGAAGESAAVADLLRFTLQGFHLEHARRCARLQRRGAWARTTPGSWRPSTRSMPTLLAPIARHSSVSARDICGSARAR